MKHLKIGIRFAIIVFWIMTVGVLYNLVTGCANCWAVGWFGAVLYGAVLIVVLYGAAVATPKLWSLK